MVHFPGLARTRLCIQRAVIWFYQIGFPHSDTPGSRPVCGFPGLIAAYRVLHRLLAPRHPPYALSSLTIKLTQHASEKLRPSKHGTKGLASPPFRDFQGCLSVVKRPEPAKIAHLSDVKRQVRLSTKRYSRAKICGLLHHANLEIRVTQCQLPSVVKDRSFRSTTSDRNVSAPGGALNRFGADAANTSEQ